MRRIYRLLLERILELFPDKKTDIVYHYTSIDTFWKLTKPDGDFKCTYFESLSDGKEFYAGLKCLTDFWRSHGGSPKVVKEDLLFQMLDGKVGDESKCGGNLRPWTMSFSAAVDNTIMWQCYTDRQAGGYAIGFDCEALIDKIESYQYMANSSWTLLTFLPCIYVAVDDIPHCESGKLSECNKLGADDDAKVQKLINYVLDDLAKELEKVLRSKDDNRNTHEIVKVANTARVILEMTLASIFKHKDFSHEKEWRLVTQPIDMTGLLSDDNSDKCPIGYVGNKWRIATGVFGRSKEMFSADFSSAGTKSVALTDFIRDIVVSPHGESQMLFQIASSRLKARQCNAILRSSSSPYKGM
jgi:hypothetical protein